MVEISLSIFISTVQRQSMTRVLVGLHSKRLMGHGSGMKAMRLSFVALTTALAVLGQKFCAKMWVDNHLVAWWLESLLWFLIGWGVCYSVMPTLAMCSMTGLTPQVSGSASTVWLWHLNPEKMAYRTRTSRNDGLDLLLLAFNQSIDATMRPKHY